MNPNHEHELEALVDRELKSLPPLPAPPSLAPRILATIATRVETPWYRRPWTTWPLAMRVPSFALLLALFGGLCFGGWKLFQTNALTVTTTKVSGVFSVVDLTLRILAVLREAALQVVQHAGSVYVIGFAVMAFLAYALCLALGSACVRFAYVRR